MSRQTPQCLFQRGHSWYARKRVPGDVIALVGRKELVEALKTRDLTIAKRRLPAVLAKWESMFTKLRRGLEVGSLFDAEPFMADAHQLRAEVQAGTLDPESAYYALSATVDQYLSTLNAPRDESTGDHDISETLVDRIRQAHTLVSQHGSMTLREALEIYLDENAGHVRKQTLNTQKRRIEAFISWLGDDDLCGNVTKQTAGRYVTESVVPLELAVGTKQGILSVLSTFFNWCALRGYIEHNPFPGLSKTIKKSSRATKAKTETRRRPWTTEELLHLVTETDSQSDLWSMSMLALYTGCRGNELAETLCTDVHASHIHIPESKTESGQRDVPIHPVIQPLVARLKKNSTDGYLVSGLLRGGEDDKRFHMFAKRFSRHLRKNLEITSPGVVYHALRHTFTTAAEQAGIQEATVSQLVGHKRQSLTFNVYSGGSDRERLLKEVSKVKFPKIDEAVRKRIKELGKSKTKM